MYYFSDLTRLSQTSLDDRRVKLDIIVLVKSDLSPKTGFSSRIFTREGPLEKSSRLDVKLSRGQRTPHSPWELIPATLLRI